MKVHKDNLRDSSLVADSGEFEFKDGAIIYYKDNTDVILIAVKDFCDYLYTSMNVSALISAKPDAKDKAAIKIRLKTDGEDLWEGNGYMGSSIIVSETGIEIIAFDERGARRQFIILKMLCQTDKIAMRKKK